MNFDGVFAGLSERESNYVLQRVTNPDQTAADAARESGYPDKSARQRASELNHKPEVQRAIEELKESIGNVAAVNVEELVKSTLIKEATCAEHSRDRQTAAVHLGRTTSMFSDRVEIVDDSTTSDLLLRIEASLGVEARLRAAEELGIDEV